MKTRTFKELYFMYLAQLSDMSRVGSHLPLSCGGQTFNCTITDVNDSDIKISFKIANTDLEVTFDSCMISDSRVTSINMTGTCNTENRGLRLQVLPLQMLLINAAIATCSELNQEFPYVELR